MMNDLKSVMLPSEQTFMEMALSPFDFYLTGSYFMECAKPDSDFDFIVQDSPEVRDFLTALGFRDMMGPAISVPPLGNVVSPIHGSSTASVGTMTITTHGGNWIAPAAPYLNVSNPAVATVFEYKSPIKDIVIQVQVCKSARIQRICRDIIFKYIPISHKNAEREDRKWLWHDLARVISFSSNDIVI